MRQATAQAAPIVMTLHVSAAESGLREARHACCDARAKQSVYFVAISDDQSAEYAPIVAPWATVHHGIDVNDFPFHIYGHDIGDTAYFDPRSSSIVHYNANRYFLVNGGPDGAWGVKQFACGVKDHLCEQGTWTDAEDGRLSGSPAAWGSADSTIGISLTVPPRGTATAYYWVAAGTQYADVTRLNQIVLEKSPAELIQLTSNYWGAWIQKEPRTFGDLPAEVTDLFHRSLLIIRTQIDNRGAIIAANDSDIVRFGRDTYSYMWGRDGAFVAAALARAGHADICRRFFGFCAEVLIRGVPTSMKRQPIRCRKEWSGTCTTRACSDTPGRGTAAPMAMTLTRCST